MTTIKKSIKVSANEIYSKNQILDTLCNLKPVEIPRPKYIGLEFVNIRRRYGFYQVLNLYLNFTKLTFFI